MNTLSADKLTSIFVQMLTATSNLINSTIIKRSKTMKKTSILVSLVLFVAAMMLSGCIFPYWDEGGGRHGGGRHGSGYGEGGHRDGGGRH